MPTVIMWASIEQYPAKYYRPKCKEMGVADKGNAMVVIDRSDYDREGQETPSGY